MAEITEDVAIQVSTEAVKQAVAYFQAHPTTHAEEGGWGPHEILAHLMFWQEHAASAIEAGTRGERLPRPPGKTDDTNLVTAAEHRTTSTAELLDRLSAAQRRILACLGNMPDPSFTVFTRGGSGQEVNAAELTYYFATHIQRHIAELEGPGLA